MNTTFNTFTLIASCFFSISACFFAIVAGVSMEKMGKSFNNNEVNVCRIMFSITFMLLVLSIAMNIIRYYS